MLWLCHVINQSFKKICGSFDQGRGWSKTNDKFHINLYEDSFIVYIYLNMIYHDLGKLN